MKQLLFIVCIVVLLTTRVRAQEDINAFDASNHIGKTVNVSGYVINVGHKPHSKVISFGLGGNQQYMAVIIHVKHFHKSYYTMLKGLLTHEVTITGQLQLFRKMPVINYYGEDLTIFEEEPLGSY